MNKSKEKVLMKIDWKIMSDVVDKNQTTYLLLIIKTMNIKQESD